MKPWKRAKAHDTITSEQSSRILPQKHNYSEQINIYFLHWATSFGVSSWHVPLSLNPWSAISVRMTVTVLVVFMPWWCFSSSSLLLVNADMLCSKSRTSRRSLTPPWSFQGMKSSTHFWQMRRGSREERGAGGVLTRTPLGPGLPCGPADPCNKEKIVVPFVTMTAH